MVMPAPRSRRSSQDLTRHDIHGRYAGAGAWSATSTTTTMASTATPGNPAPLEIEEQNKEGHDRQTIMIGVTDPVPTVEEESPSRTQYAETRSVSERSNQPNVRSQRPDGVFIDWNRRDLVILEFTRPMDNDLQSLGRADSQKEEKYGRLKSKLERTLPFGWTIKIVTFSVGVRGTIDQDRWEQALTTVGVPKAGV